MFTCHPTVAEPAWMALLALLPVLWWRSYRRLGRLGRARRRLVLVLRTLAIALLVLAAAGFEIVRSNDRLTVIYLLDQSLSIPQSQRAAMLKCARDEVRAHRRDEDRAGMIVFGREAAIELPPLDGDLRAGSAIESELDPQATNIAAAVKLARAAFPGDTARRIVLVSDGNQNQGDALDEARAASAAGIGIDVLPVRCEARGDVDVQRVILPGEVRLKEPFDVRVVLCNRGGAAAAEKGEVSGRLVVQRIVDDQPLGRPWEQRVTLPPGKKVFNLRQSIDSPNFCAYEARFVPDRPQGGVLRPNHRATAFTHVAGKGQVLLIVSRRRAGEYDALAQRLRQEGLEVVVRESGHLFSSLAELQAYDTVVLADVPRASSDRVGFSDQQIDMLVRNTQQLGGGLVMLGGAESFGAGGWAGTELEKAMPVDFQIENATIVPGGALVMVIDKSGSMAGQKIAMCKAAAVEAAKVLGPQDFVGVVAFDVDAHWMAPMRRNGGPAAVVRGVSRLGGSGGTNMKPAMLEGFAALRRTESAVKHMILLTDGETMGSGYPELAARMLQEGITVSSVAVGEDADRKLMQSIAQAGGGNYYFVNSPRAIPRIFQREARRVARSLLYENESGIEVRVKTSHEMLSGIDRLPPIKGYVLTRKKENPLVETVLVAAKPGGEENRTILAGWNYGLGRAVAFTTDAGLKWTSDWGGSPTAGKLIAQVVRWSMRPSGGSGRLTAAFKPEEGKMRVVVTALDQRDNLLNFLAMTGTIVGPDLKKPLDLRLEQTAPGRYAGTFPVDEPGGYFVTIDPGGGIAPLRTGVSVPCSDEFRDSASNDELLRQLAAMRPKDGPPGQLIESPARADALDAPLALNSFRHDLPQAANSQEAWHWLVLMASCFFLGDVFVRRVSVNFAWLHDFVLHRQLATAQPPYIERLKSRKAEVAGRLEQLRAATRLKMSVGTPIEVQSLDEPSPQASAQPRPANPPIVPEKKETYTGRLLQAKKDAWREKQ